MKNWITQLVGVFATVALLSSCEKDEVRAVSEPNTSLPIVASAASVNITPANTSAPGVTYTWQPANFGFDAAVTYTLQFAPQGSNFSKLKEFNVGPSLSKSFTIGEVNAIYNSLNCNITTVTPTTLDVRVKATVSDKIATVYSPVTTLLASPYQAQTAPAQTWAIIGSATSKGWDGDTPLTYDYCSQTWQGVVTLTAQEFKFRANGTWDLNLGDDGADKKLEQNGANIAVSQAGTYLIVLNANASPRTYTITKQ